MAKRNQTGLGGIIIVALILSVVMIGVTLVIQMNKSKHIQRVMAEEHNIRTYYVALSGINECIATRMAPRSNVMLKNKKLNSAEKEKFNRLQNSGVIYYNPYRQKATGIIGEYTYVSYVLTKDSDGNYVVDEHNVDPESEKYLVYSKGETILPDGAKDSLIIKAVFDLNRFDGDTFDADEMEEFKVLPANSKEANLAESLIMTSMNDTLPPMVKEIKFNKLDGSEILVEVKKKTDSIKVKDVGVRGSISIKFTEPIDAAFLDGVKLSELKTDKLLENLEKIPIYPRNTEVVIMPPKKTDGTIFKYDTSYKLEISGIADYNGNVLPDGPEIIFKTESKQPDSTSQVQSSSIVHNVDTKPDTKGDPFSSGFSF